MDPLMMIQILVLIVSAIILVSLYWQDRKKPKKKR